MAYGVVIGKSEDFSSGNSRAGMSGVMKSQIGFIYINNACFFSNLPGIIGGILVNYDYFVLLFRQALFLKTIQGILQIFSPVVGWDDSRNQYFTQTLLTL